MSLRVPLLLLQNYCKKPNISNLHSSILLACNQQYTSTSSVHDVPKQNVGENMEASKYLPPLMDQSVNEALSLVNLQHTSANTLVAVLKTLRMNTLFKGVDSASFKSTEQFKILCEIFEKHCSHMEPNLLISGLRSLLEVGESPNAPWVIKAEKRVLENIDRFTAFNLIGCLYFHRKFTETALQKQVVSELVKKVPENISEVYSSSEAMMLVHVLNMFDEGNRKIVEQKIAEIIPTLKAHEMCKVVTTLSENSSRNIVILNAVSFHLRQKQEKPDIKDAVDLLYAFNKLNFIDTKLFALILNHFAPQIPSVKQPSIISGFLTTCGQMRFRHAEMLNACGDWILAQGSTCRTRELVAYVLSVASLSHLCPQTDRVLLAILPHLSRERVQSKDIWLDIVWSLAILDFVDKNMLQNVLSAEFHRQLIDGSDFKATTNKLKLMNLKTVQKIHHPECIFGCDLFLEPTQIPESTVVQNSRKHVIKVLSNFVPKEKYICSSQNTDMGIFIDAEFIMDKNLKPLPLLEFGIKAKATSITKPLPANSNRISLLIFFHKDFILNSSSLIGSHALAVRLLSAQGYTIIKVPFSEFLSNGTEVKKAKYLIDKIKKYCN